MRFRNQCIVVNQSTGEVGEPADVQYFAASEMTGKPGMDHSMGRTSSHVNLFIPCFVDQFFPETGIATARLLESLGVEVRYNERQTCCGQPAFNSGFHDEAAHLASRFLRLFANGGDVVAPSASCVAMVRKHYGELALGAEDAQRWESLKGRVWELSEYLDQVLGVKEVKASFPHKVAYHASCHGLRELGILDGPLRLLGSVNGLELVELDDHHACCGFGGTFAAKFSALSAAIGEDKLEAIRRTGAHYVTATDDSCLMHLAGMMSRKKMDVRVMHYAQILTADLMAGGVER